jgi:[acyl-carrier-protein] S-malonyltransferase
MSKIAFLFSGQGSQYVGMGKELYEKYEVVRNTLDGINTILGFDLLDIIMNGPEDELKRTENTQPAILAVSVALTRLLQEKGIYPQAAAGLSLGEYSALVAGSAMKFEDALPLVKKRGRFMQEAVPAGVGTMAAIIGLDRDVLNEVLNDASLSGVVQAANYNCPGQIAIAGEVKAVEKAVEIARERGASRSVILQVSAPFHSSLLKPAGDNLSNELCKIHFSDLSMPVVANVDGDYYKSGRENIIANLTNQVYSPVYFEDSIRKLMHDGYDTFVEVGPGRVLSGFVKRIDKSIVILNVEDVKSLDKTLEALGIS